MGTRHLIAVIQGGTHKIAQYGQWDGYPDGQGADILKFLKSADLDQFTERVSKLRYATEEDFKALNEAAGIDSTGGWITLAEANRLDALAPQYDRAAGARILDLVNEGKATVVQNSYEFAWDSLFCEYAYVIDLDTRRFEAYRGFQHSPHTAGRFVQEKNVNNVEYREEQYYPVRLLASWPLDALPTVEQLEAEYARAEEEVYDKETEDYIPQVPNLDVVHYLSDGVIQGS